MKTTACALPKLLPVNAVRYGFLLLVIVSRTLYADEFRPNPVGAMDFLKMIFSLLALMAIMFLMYQALKRITVPKGGGRYFKMMDRATIAPQTMLLLCQVGSKCYLLASSPRAITLLDSFDQAPVPIPTSGADLSFRKVLNQLLPGTHES